MCVCVYVLFCKITTIDVYIGIQLISQQEKENLLRVKNVNLTKNPQRRLSHHLKLKLNAKVANGKLYWKIRKLNQYLALL